MSVGFICWVLLEGLEVTIVRCRRRVAKMRADGSGRFEVQLLAARLTGTASTPRPDSLHVSYAAVDHSVMT